MLSLFVRCISQIPPSPRPPPPPSIHRWQDGDSLKTSESSNTEEKKSESSSPPDSSLHLVALDLKWFVTLHHALLSARDAVVLAGDMIEKNTEKILRPKGNNSGRGGMYAF